MSVSLTNSQLFELQNLNDQARYADAYNYLRDIVKQAIPYESDFANSKDLDIIQNWLDRASNINADDGSIFSEFVRGATASGAASEGITITDQQFQDASNQLARDVISRILADGSIPDATTIISQDLDAAVKGLGVPVWVWAGSIGDLVSIPLFGLGRNFVDVPADKRAAVTEANLDGMTRAYNRWKQDNVDKPISDFLDQLSKDFLKKAIGLGDSIRFPMDVLMELLKKFRTAETIVSPIVLDLNGDGISTTGVTYGTRFDHDANGFAEATGWVNAQDGILVLDRSGNGSIDSGRELFGSETLLANGQKAANGYEALKELDSNLDGQISSQDAAYTTLKMWKDANADGYSSADELITLAEAGVQSIATGYAAVNQLDANGNITKQTGTYTKTDGSTGNSADIWFNVNKTNIIATTRLTETAAVAALPDLQGFGNVYDLRQGMLRDGSGHLQDLCDASNDAVFEMRGMAA